MTLSNLEVNSARQRWCCQWLALRAALREWLWQGPMWVKIHTVHDGNNSMAPQPDRQKQARLSPFLHVTRCIVGSRTDSATHCLESELHGSSKINGLGAVMWRWGHSGQLCSVVFVMVASQMGVCTKTKLCNDHSTSLFSCERNHTVRN